MKISIVTAVYNRERTISGTIKSVQEQSYPYIEHIIQDGGSTDRTLDIINSIADSRTLIISEPDNGLYDAINRGILRASGDVIGLLHSDDSFTSPRVLELVAKALSDPAIDGVYGDLEYVADNASARVVRYWKAGEYSRNSLKLGWMPPHPTLYLRRGIFERLGTYDLRYQIAADYDAMLRWFWNGRINVAYVPDVFVRMRVGGESNRTLGRIIRKSREDYQAIKTNGVGGVMTLLAKNIRKFDQFWKRRRRQVL